MKCPKCQVELKTEALIKPTNGQGALSVLKDWRTWVGALVISLASGLLPVMLDLSPRWGSVGGGVIGLFVALRWMSLVKCPHCAAVFATPIGSKTRKA